MTSEPSTQTTAADSTPKRTEWSKVITGALGAVTGILTAASQFSGAFKDAITKMEYFKDVPVSAWLALAGLCLILGIVAILDGLTRRSQRIKPDAFILDIKDDNPSQLGRDADIRRLKLACIQSSQVHLIAESGAGKSTLVREGLCPLLRSDKQGLLPVYIQSWDPEWEDGPRLALYDALRISICIEGEKSPSVSRALEAGQPLKSALDGKDPFELLRVFSETQSRKILCIFDQFDDYQLIHRDRFLIDQAWVTPEELAKSNTFWCHIKNCLREHQIHCLFVTRDDTADGLGSIRFTQPKELRLHRPDADFALSVLDRLTEKQGAIFAPEKGWNLLKERLKRDLSHGAGVLPAQLKMALVGLNQLKFLTITEYERQGALRGLEANHIRHYIENAALTANMSPADFTKILLLMVDKEGRKTKPLTEDDLPSDSSAIQKAFEQLADDQIRIVRRRPDPQTGKVEWVLHHDYLCNGVLALYERENRVSLLIEQNRESFDKAASVRQKWGTLLSPYQQLYILFRRFSGSGFRYNQFLGYATLSTVRFLPWLLVFCVAFFVARQIHTTQEADRLLDYLAVAGSDVSEKEVEFLQTLATSSDSVKGAYLHAALNSPGNAKLLFQHREHVLHALTGIDPAKRAAIITMAQIQACAKNEGKDRLIRLACISIGIELSVRDNDFLKTSWAFLFDCLKMEIGEISPFSLIQLIEKLAALIPDNYSEEAYQSIFLVLTENHRLDQYEFQWVVRILKNLPPVSSRQTLKMLMAIKKLLQERRISTWDIGESVSYLASSLSPSDASILYQGLIDISLLDDLEIRYTLKRLGTAFIRTTASKLTPEDAKRFRFSILEILKQRKVSQLVDYLSTLVQPLGSPDALYSQKRDAEIMILAKEMSTSKHPRDVLLFAKTIGALIPEKLQSSPLEMTAALDKCIEIMSDVVGLELDIQDSVNSLGYVFQKLLEKSQAKPNAEATTLFFRQLVNHIETIRDPAVLESVFYLLNIMRTALPKTADIEKLSQHALDLLLKQFLSASSPSSISHLSMALGQISDLLSQEQWSKVFDRLLGAMEQTQEYDDIERLCTVISEMKFELSPERVEQSLKVFLRVLHVRSVSVVIEKFDSALIRVSRDISPIQGERLVHEYINEAMNSQSSIRFNAVMRILTALHTKQQTGHLIQLLKHPLSVGESRKMLMEIIEGNSEQDFHGDIWKLIDWAAVNFDIKSPLIRDNSKMRAY